MKKLTLFILCACFSAGMYAADFFVDAAISSSGDGSTWALAKKTIAESVTLAKANGTTADNIYVKAGTYGEKVDLTATNCDNISLYGGYPAGNAGNSTANRDIVVKVTIIDGGNTTTIIATNNSTTNGRQGVVISKAGCLVDGFTIQNCYLVGYSNHTTTTLTNAAGVNMVANSTISNCIIRNNYHAKDNAKVWGGGIFMSAGTVQDCHIFNNRAVATSTITVMQGGGVVICGGTLQRCKIYNNNAGSTGNAGGVLLGLPNTTNGFLGTYNALAANVTVVNNLIYNNGLQGLFVRIIDATKTVSVINNTIVNNANVCSLDGAGIANLVATNNVFHNNGGINETFAMQTNYSYNAIQKADVSTGAGINNIALASGSQATLFTSPTATTGIIADASSNWLPLSGSGLYNVGLNSAAVGSVDIAGNTRIQQTTIDLGAYETSLASGATPTISSTGTLSGLSTTYGTASSSTSFSVSGADMTEGISVNPPVGFQVSTASDFSSNVGTNGSPITVGTAGTFSATTVYVRILATATVGSYSGNIVLSSADATSVNVATVSSTVTAATANKTGGNIDALGLTDPELANTDITLTSGELVVNTGKTVRSITVNAGAKLSVADGQTLTLTNLTLKSNVSGTSTYVPTGTLKNGTLTVTGTTNVEQYFGTAQYKGAERNWYISSPLASASSSIFTSAGTLWKYNEPNTGTTGSPINTNWDLISTHETMIGGYIFRPTAASPTITLTGGALNTGSKTVDLYRSATANTANKGFNLIGNPYPSYLNAMTAINAKSELTKAIWYRTLASDNSKYYYESVVTTTGVGTNNALTGKVTGYIPPMQAFWVKTSAATTITFDNSMRAHAFNVPVGETTVPTTPLKVSAESSIQQLLRLQVSNGASNDETIVYFHPNASNNYDNYDAPKRSNGNVNIPEIYTLANSEKLVINGMNELKLETEIPVVFSTGSANNFTIKATELSNFQDTKIILTDKQNPTFEFDLTDGTAYSFSSDVANDVSRFSILFRTPSSPNAVNTIEKLNAKVFVNAANQITIVAPEKSKYAIYNAVGMLVDNGQTTAKLQTTNCKLQTGVYVVRVANGGRNYTSRVIIK